MTVRDLIAAAGQYPLALLIAFVVPPAAAWLVGNFHERGPGGAGRWRFVYAALVYFACVPGMFACVVTAYMLFFSRENLLDSNLLVNFLPVASMIATLVLIGKNVPFDEVPGFDRLSGLMVMVGCSFAVALAIQKTNIWIFFGASIEKLFALAAVVFALLKWGSFSLFRRGDEPKQKLPAFPASGL